MNKCYISDNNCAFLWVRFPSSHLGIENALILLESLDHIFLQLELRFRRPARDIPPFLPLFLGLEWTFMDLSGLEPEVASVVISRNPSKVKDSGIILRSPIYGAGEGNRTLDVSLGSSSFAIKLHLHLLCLYSIPQKPCFVSLFFPLQLSVSRFPQGWRLYRRSR